MMANNTGFGLLFGQNNQSEEISFGEIVMVSFPILFFYH